MIAIILLKKIISFFLILVGGYLLVKKRILKSSESRVLSLIFLNLVMPCGIINAFQVEYDAQVMEGLMFSFAVAIGVHILFVLANMLIRRPLHLNPVEQATIIYPACANLTLPLVIAMMGEEWAIYTSGFLAVQMFLLWSHCKGLLCGERGIDLKKVLTNINMVCVFIGIGMFLCHIRLTGPVQDAVATLGNMMGPMCMLIAGMLIAEADVPSILRNPRIWMVAGLRLVAVPLVLIGLFRLTGISRLVPDGEKLLLVTLMGLNTPPASTIIQMTQVYTGDQRMAEYASALNVICTLLCIVTMPIIVTIWMI